MYDKEQFRDVIRRTLREFEQVGGAAYSEDAVTLLMMIAAHESGLGTYLRQIRGPALGPFQMEPETLRDMYRTFISVTRRYDFAVAYFVPSKKSLSTPDYIQLLETDLRYAIITARTFFVRFQEPIPTQGTGSEQDHLKALAAYAKKYWNTVHGKATEEEYFLDYMKRGYIP